MDDSSAVFLLMILFFIVRLFSGKKKKKNPASPKPKQNIWPEMTPPVQKEKPPEPAEGEGYSILRAEQQVMQPSGEGEDRCDPSLGHHRVVEPESVYAQEITDEGKKLDLSAQGVWQGVVMSEVLARPAAARNHGWKRN